ncbi:MAG: hypothetical protein GY862_34195, partial [Gammaproteobacteria bacterium]|nr:hypothetical protein [Gammaproteobacteria bacterium]
MPHLAANDAGQLLNSLLQDKGLQADIPPEKRREVTEWLGGNPRALQVLVSSLAYDSLNT